MEQIQKDWTNLISKSPRYLEISWLFKRIETEKRVGRNEKKNVWWQTMGQVHARLDYEWILTTRRNQAKSSANGRKG